MCSLYLISVCKSVDPFASSYFIFPFNSSFAGSKLIIFGRIDSSLPSCHVIISFLPLRVLRSPFFVTLLLLSFSLNSFHSIFSISLYYLIYFFCTSSATLFGTLYTPSLSPSLSFPSTPYFPLFYTFSYFLSVLILCLMISKSSVFDILSTVTFSAPSTQYFPLVYGFSFYFILVPISSFMSAEFPFFAPLYTPSFPLIFPSAPWGLCWVILSHLLSFLLCFLFHPYLLSVVSPASLQNVFVNPCSLFSSRHTLY